MIDDVNLPAFYRLGNRPHLVTQYLPSSNSQPNRRSNIELLLLALPFIDLLIYFILLYVYLFRTDDDELYGDCFMARGTPGRLLASRLYEHGRLLVESGIGLGTEYKIADLLT